MLLLAAVAFVAGIVTALSPCVLPVLPVILASGATGSERRPYAVVAGLVVSFTVFTLTAAALLTALGLPDDLLRNISIVVVALVGVALVWPRLGTLLERPFARLSRRSSSDLGGGFLLGLSLGLVFTPCAGPVIAAVATVAATERSPSTRSSSRSPTRSARGSSCSASRSPGGAGSRCRASAAPRPRSGAASASR